MDFSCVRSKAGLLSSTSTPAADNAARLSSFSETPLRRLGLSMTRTTTPRRCASTTAAISDGSVKTNILMRSDLVACLMASKIGFAESSGNTTRLRDISTLPPADADREKPSPVVYRTLHYTTRHRFPPAPIAGRACLAPPLHRLSRQ